MKSFGMFLRLCRGVILLRRCWMGWICVLFRVV